MEPVLILFAFTILLILQLGYFLDKLTNTVRKQEERIDKLESKVKELEYDISKSKESISTLQQRNRFVF